VMKINRQLVFVCSGSDCKEAGSKRLRKDLKEAVHAAGLKGQCKFFQTKCMDMCKTAPMVIVGDHFCKKADTKSVIDQIKKA
jgi:NADH:ubiquinone oxidoreductase subunit E